VLDPQPGGNANGRFDAGETGGLELALRNAGNQDLGDAAVTLRTGNPLFVVLDSMAVYGTSAACSTRANAGDPLTVQVDPSIPLETPVTCSLFVTGTGYCDTLRFTVVIGQIRANDPIPDGPRRPSLYWAYDDCDTLYDQHPDFNWVEIGGIGTQMVLDDDEIQTISLPAAFGPFVYYGQSYDQLSICSNGFAAPGAATNSNYTNGPLPDASMPPLLGAHWDDLVPQSGGGVWYFHDAANHRFVVEWDSVPLFSSSTFEKFEIVLYDTTMSEGDCAFAFQYLDMPGVAGITVGIQDPTASIAICCLANGSYHRGTAPIAAGRAIRFTPEAPTTGVSDKPRSSLTGPILRAFPNPFSNSVSFCLNPGTLDPSTPSSIRIYDNSGRLIRSLTSLTWDAKDAAGRLVSPGVYFCQ
jgi:hypothetical protein